MKRGIGIKFQAAKLTPERLCDWLFETVGEIRSRTSDGSIVCSDEDRGVYITWNAQAGVLRIALWTEASEEQAWPIINDWAKSIAWGCQCELTTWAIDLYEYDESSQGYACKYDALVPGDILEKSVVSPVVKKKVAVH